MNTNVELELVFQETIKKQELKIPFDSYQEAYNFRQRLYRYRESLRNADADASPLSLVVDHFTFVVQGPALVCSYEPTIWEKMQDGTQSRHTEDSDRGSS